MSGVPVPPSEDLRKALASAGATHHDYEANFLKGEPDTQWPGFYAAFVLGRHGNFTTATALTKWLESAPASDDWSSTAAAYVVEQIRS